MHISSPLLPTASLTLLLFAACSSTPPPQPVVAAPTPAPAVAQAPQLLQAGYEVEAATDIATVLSVDTDNRKLTLRRGNGTTAIFKAGTNMVNFAQIKAGDDVLATFTENCAFFVVKGGAKTGAAGLAAVARSPKGGTPEGVFLETIEVNAKVMDVDFDMRRVLLQYGTDQAKSFQAGPNVDLTNVAVGDEVLIRGTEAMAIAVEKR
jgi:hypothetical protein